MFANKKAIIVLSVILVLLAATIGGYFYVTSTFSQNLALKGNKVLAVKRGETLHQVCGKLAKKGYIDDCLSVKLYSKMSDTYTNIQSGSYEINSGLTLGELLLAMVNGQVKQYRFTIIEGDNVYQVLDKISMAKHLVDDVSTLGMAELAKKVGLDSDHPEGWLYPETYLYPANSKASELLARAVKAQQQELNQAWQNKAKNLPLSSPYEALILASIIEKESSVAAERNKVASVFHNRLNKKMRLQTDPTVIYGVWKEYNGDITRAHLREKTPYNTYRINGFPPTPIANPSKASLHAALNPAKTDYLYFVASGDGDHIFSTNLDAHNRALRNFLRKQRINKLKDNNG